MSTIVFSALSQSTPTLILPADPSRRRAIIYNAQTIAIGPTSASVATITASGIVLLAVSPAGNNAAASLTLNTTGEVWAMSYTAGTAFVRILVEGWVN